MMFLAEGSDQNLSIVCHGRLCCRCRFRKLLTFYSSSQEPLGQFQPNLAQRTLFQKEIITK